MSGYYQVGSCKFCFICNSSEDLFVVMSLQMKRSLVKLSGVVYDVTKMGTECPRATKVSI